MDKKHSRLIFIAMVLTLSKKAINDLIIEPEVSSEAYYKSKLQSPIWPGGKSGITISLGYDVGMTTPLQIQKDWGGILSPTEIGLLKKFSGKTGEICKTYLPINIKISWDNALKVFYATSLRDHARMAISVYKDLDKLHPYEQTAIVGLVYNRGNSTIDSLGSDRRKEMKLLIDAIHLDNDTLMSALIRQMKRLWVGKGQDGILKRREDEARYIEMIDTPIPEDDKLLIEI